jgi:hypothetical protein
MPPAPEKLISADTVALLTVPDWSKSKVGYAKSCAGRLWNDPEMKPFKEKFIQKLNAEAFGSLELGLGFGISNLLALAEGEATLVISQNGWDGTSPWQPAWLFLIETKDKSNQLKTNLTELKKKWLDSGRPIKATKIRDVEFAALAFSPGVITNQSEKADQKSSPGQNAAGSSHDSRIQKSDWLLGQVDSLLLFGNSATNIDQTLARLSAGTSSTNLVAQPDFATNQAALSRDSLAFGWIGLKQIVAVQAQKHRAAPTPGVQMLPLPEKILEASGLGGAQSFSFNWRETGTGTAMEFFLDVPSSSQKGIFKILAGETKESNPPPWVPADTVRFMRWRLDFQKAWSNLETMLTEISPQSSKDKDPDFDLEKSLISNLGDDLIFFESRPAVETNAVSKRPSAIYLVGARNAEQLAASLHNISSILPADPGAPREREAQGRKIYSLTLPEVSLSEGVKPSTNHVSFAVSSNYVAFASDPAVLAEFMRISNTTNRSLSDLPGFTEAAKSVGGMGTGLFGFINQHESLRKDWEELRNHPEALADLWSAFALAKRLGLSEEIMSLQRWFNFAMLPAYETVAKHFHFAVYSGGVATNGFSFRLFSSDSAVLAK